MTSHLLDFWLSTLGGDDTDSGEPRIALRLTKVGVPSIEHPDYSTIIAIRGGDRKVFDALVRKQAPELLRFGRCILNNLADAEEAVQDIFLWLWRNRADWNPKAGIRPYLLRAVSNRARNMKAARENHYRLEMERVEKTMEYELLVNEQDPALWAAVRNLPDRWREAVMLRYVEGLAFGEVGETMGVSEDAAKKLVKRALMALRSDLTQV